MISDRQGDRIQTLVLYGTVLYLFIFSLMNKATEPLLFSACLPLRAVVYAFGLAFSLIHMSRTQITEGGYLISV